MSGERLILPPTRDDEQVVLWRMIKEAREEFGALDIFVNNALGRHGPLASECARPTNLAG